MDNMRRTLNIFIFVVVFILILSCTNKQNSKSDISKDGKTSDYMSENKLLQAY